MKRRKFFAVLAGLPLASGGVRAAQIDGVDLFLDIEQGFGPEQHDLIRRWVEKSAVAIQRYYGRFPVPSLDLVVSPQARGDIGGRSIPGDPPMISISVHESAGEDDLLMRDWVMVHEMVHLAIPYVPRRHFWAAEGLAVYVESIARIQAGHVEEKGVWREFMRQMPKGLPQANEGLAQSDSWGRRYWGGALFFLLADILIRKATGNRKGLQTALRGINAKMDFRQELDEVLPILQAGDAATGTQVLTTLYHEMAMAGGTADLPALWHDLGIEAAGASVEFVATAPLSAIRQAITQPA